jgi:hypothetical protein
MKGNEKRITWGACWIDLISRLEQRNEGGSLARPLSLQRFSLLSRVVHSPGGRKLGRFAAAGKQKAWRSTASAKNPMNEEVEQLGTPSCQPRLLQQSSHTYHVNNVIRTSSTYLSSILSQCTSTRYTFSAQRTGWVASSAAVRRAGRAAEMDKSGVEG